MKDETTQVLIRRIAPSEWALHRDLRLRALASDPLAFGSTLAREQAYPEDLWKERTARSASSEEATTLLAIVPGDRPVGMVVAALVNEAPHIFGMWVEPSWRGRGVGGRLLDEALEWTGQVRPTSEVQLEVNPNQAAAVALYESRGFVRTGAVSPLGHTAGESVIGMKRPSRST